MADGWIPKEAKPKGENEPRNGVIMCRNHHRAFDSYNFFIRFFPDV